MFGKEERQEVEEEIAELRDQFGDMSPEEFRKGNWLVQLIRQVLSKRSKNVSAEYFEEKYPGLDDLRTAHQLKDTAAKYTGAAGAAAAAAVSAGELSTVVSGGTSWALVGSSMMGELAYITQRQIKLIYDLSLILNAELDTDDPEDAMAILWLALDVNIYEEASNFLLKAGPRGAAYLGRKTLRKGLREAMQKALSKFGGTALARKLTERSLLKLIVPGINMPIAYGVNKWFTKKLGNKAIGRLKHRSLMVEPLREMDDAERVTKLLVLPILFHVGISPESKDINSRLVEMQAVTTRKIGVREEENDQIRDWINMTYDAFLERVDVAVSDGEAEPLRDVGVGAHLLSTADEASREKLDDLADVLDAAEVDGRIQFMEDRYL